MTKKNFINDFNGLFQLCFLLIPLSLSTAKASNYYVEVLATGLDQPWSIAEIPNEQLLITEKTGQLIRIGTDRSITKIIGVPEVFYAGQGGLLEVLPHPEFDQNQNIFLSYASGNNSKNQTSVARGVLRNDTLTNVEVILKVKPTKKGSLHYGGRLAFLPDHTLLVTVGDGFSYREQAQDIRSELGKLLRIHTDGSSPSNNPFPRIGPRVFSYGHRNPQGLFFDSSTKTIFMHEHGPKGGDELNMIEAGLNYGWPAITYGVDYSGAIISPYKEADGMEQPLKYWVPSIGPSGLAIYHGDDFPEWEGDFLLGSLINREVRRLKVEQGAIKEEMQIFPEVSGRARDIRVLKNGSVVVITDEGDLVKFYRGS